VDDDDDDDETMEVVDVRDSHASIPVTHRRPAPTTSKDIDSETDLESGRKSDEEEELDNEDPDDSDLQHLDKASLKEKMSSEVCSP
jgi:hypothetical protein